MAEDLCPSARSADPGPVPQTWREKLSSRSLCKALADRLPYWHKAADLNYSTACTKHPAGPEFMLMLPSYVNGDRVHQVTIDRVPSEGKSVTSFRDERHPASEPNAGLAHHHGRVHREEHRREQGHAHHWFGECSFVPIAWGETTANVHNRLREPSALNGTARMRPAPDGRSTSPATSSRPAPTAGPSRRR